MIPKLVSAPVNNVGHAPVLFNISIAHHKTMTAYSLRSLKRPLHLERPTISFNVVGTQR